MYKINEDLSIYATRGDIVLMSVSASVNGEPYTFQPGDLVRIKVCKKKSCTDVVLEKDFPITAVTQNVQIFLSGEDTKFGDVISKPTDYWYEVELNPLSEPQTIIGYDEDGAKVFKLFPEGADKELEEYETEEEELLSRYMDDELDLTSTHPVENQVIARAIARIEAGYKETHAAVAEMHVTPQMYGAIGDGESDDTEALKKMLLSGSSVRIPKGVFVTNEPLYVNVNTTTLTGESSCSVIKAGEYFPEGEAIVTFYSPSGDYYDRRYRERTHGNFGVVGRGKLCDGVRFGGKVGSEHEGNVECSIFQNIFVDACNAAYLWGAHAYRNTLIQCDSHSNNYCLKTTDDITDTGEVFTCINCGFWSGALYLVNCGEIMMHSCTIHTKTVQVVGGVETGHYFKDTFISFQNCHFEAILQSTAEKEKVYAPQFWAKNALVHITECTGVISSTTNMTLASYLFKNESDNGRSSGIFVRGGQWKYYFGRIRPNTALCSGNCELRDISMKYLFDGISIPYKIYEETNAFAVCNQNVSYEHLYGLGNVKPTVTITSNTKAEKKYSITLDDVSASAIGIYRKVDITGYKTCIINGNISFSASTDKATLASNSNSPSIIMFMDKEGNYLNWGDPYNVDLFTDGNSLAVAGRFIAIPPRAKYALIGFDIRRGGGFWNTDETPIQVTTSLTFELV